MGRFQRNAVDGVRVAVASLAPLLVLAAQQEPKGPSGGALAWRGSPHAGRSNALHVHHLVDRRLRPMNRAMRSNRSFDTDAQRRTFALLRSSPPVAGQFQR